MKTFTACAKIDGRVYCTLAAKDMEDAIKKLRNGYCDGDWNDEEWVSRPEIISVTDDETDEMFDDF